MYRHGASSIEEMKVATPKCTIEVERDLLWRELVDLGATFASHKRHYSNFSASACGLSLGPSSSKAVF